MNKPSVHIGDRFGRLVAMAMVGRVEDRHLLFLCRCDCGGKSTVPTKRLRSGNTTSCGCFRKEQALMAVTKHGKCGSPEYRSWRGMLTRCYRQKGEHWRWYGERGIKVCDRWRRSFENFLADVGHKPSPKHSLDRIDNDGNYEPGNVRWATPKQQANNRRERGTASAKQRTQG